MKLVLKNTPIPKFPFGVGAAENPAEYFEALKSIRGWMLTESDWTQTVDSPLDEETKLAWREWRQAMRDITDGVTVETIGEWIEIPNPPQKGQPYVWQFWEYDTFNEIQDVIRGISQESIDSIKTQEQEALQAQNFHQH
jgi:hypothetical protein